MFLRIITNHIHYLDSNITPRTRCPESVQQTQHNILITFPEAYSLITPNHQRTSPSFHPHQKSTWFASPSSLPLQPWLVRPPLSDSPQPQGQGLTKRHPPPASHHPPHPRHPADHPRHPKRPGQRRRRQLRAVRDGRVPVQRGLRARLLRGPRRVRGVGRHDDRPRCVLQHQGGHGRGQAGLQLPAQRREAERRVRRGRDAGCGEGSGGGDELAGCCCCGWAGVWFIWGAGWGC